MDRFMRIAKNPLWLAATLAAALFPQLAGSALAADAPATTNPPPPLHLSLTQAMSDALSLNPGLKAAGHQSAAAKHDASAVARGRWGEVDALGSYSYLNDDQLIRPLSSELLAQGMANLPFDRSQAQYGVAYQFPLYLGGKLNNQIRIARLESQKAESLLEGNRWQVRFNVASLYSTAQALDQVLVSLGEQIAALQQTKGRLDEMVELGKRPEVDRLKVVDELEGVKGQRANVRADRIKVGALLLSVLGRDPAVGVTVDALPEKNPLLATGEQSKLQAQAAGNSAVRSARLATEQADSGVKVARSEFLPKAYAGANYLDHTGTEIDRTLDTWGASVSVVFPLFEGNARFKRMDAASQRHAAARELLSEVQLKVQAELQEALARLEAARTNLAASQAQVAAASEAARIEQVRYDTGASTIEDLLRARAREEGAKAARASAQAGLVTAGERINTVVEKEVVQ
jgi:outer membrane protein TolC